MAKTLSPAEHSALTAHSSAAAYAYLLEIHHATLQAPIRLAAFDQVVSYNGNDFTPLAFSIDLPDDQPDALPRGVLSIDNVSYELSEFVDSTFGGDGVSIDIHHIRVGATLPLFSLYGLAVTQTTLNAQRLSVTIGYDNLLARPAVSMRMTPGRLPGVY